MNRGGGANHVISAEKQEQIAQTIPLALTERVAAERLKISRVTWRKYRRLLMASGRVKG